MKFHSIPFVQLPLVKVAGRNTFIIFSITPEEVRRGDISRFLREFRDQPLADRKGLRRMRHSILFGFDYTPSDKEIFEIPEVISFMKQANAAWPCWSYYCLPDPGLLRTLLATALADDGLRWRTKGGMNRFDYPLERQLEELVRWCSLARHLASKSGLSVDEVREHTKETLGLFLNEEGIELLLESVESDETDWEL